MLYQGTVNGFQTYLQTATDTGAYGALSTACWVFASRMYNCTEESR